MVVKVTKEFKWAEDGNHVRTVRVGELLEGRGAEVAIQTGNGEAVRETSESERPSILHNKPAKGK